MNLLMLVLLIIFGFQGVKPDCESCEKFKFRFYFTSFDEDFSLTREVEDIRRRRGEYGRRPVRIGTSEEIQVDVYVLAQWVAPHWLVVPKKFIPHGAQLSTHLDVEGFTFIQVGGEGPEEIKVVPYFYFSDNDKVWKKYDVEIRKMDKAILKLISKYPELKK